MHTTTSTPSEPSATWHIRFTTSDEQLLRQKAAQAGMSMTAYIKRAAISARIIVLDFAVLTQHAIQIGDIASDVRTILTSPHPDRWLYQADLEALEDKLEELISVEQKIYRCIHRTLR